MDYFVNWMSIHAKLCFTGVQPLRIEERNLWTLLFIYRVSTSPVGWRLTRKISSIMPDTLIIMDYRRQFFMCLSLLMVSVIPELKGRFLNFSDDPLFSTFTGNGKVGSNYGIRMVVKTWEAHGDFYTFLHFSRPFYERKEVFFSKDVLNWLLISDLSLGIRKLFLALLWGRKITFQEQRMNGMLMKNIVVVKDLSASILKCW